MKEKQKTQSYQYCTTFGRMLSQRQFFNIRNLFALILTLCVCLTNCNKFSSFKDFYQSSHINTDQSYQSVNNYQLTKDISNQYSQHLEKSSIVSSYSLINGYTKKFNWKQLSKQQTNFTHLVLDHSTDRLYIGATNYLLEFNSNLELIQKQHIGPIADNPQCSSTDCFDIDSKEIKLTNNYNKILLLDSEQNKLIICGSVKQGSCLMRNLDSKNNKEQNERQKFKDDTSFSELDLIKIPVAANDENSSTIAFIGPAHYGLEKTRVLYVAVTNTKLGNYRELVPAISARSLSQNSSEPFRIIESSFTDTARVDISSHLRDYYLVHYIYGFYYGDQIYFAQVQKRSHLRTQEELGYHTRLSKICASDAGFKSYAEITLECKIEDQTKVINYNVLRAATLTKMGENLADGLSFSGSFKSNSKNDGQDVLIGVFSLAKDHSVRYGDYSAVCAFPMSEIERKFRENIHLCYNGSVRSRNMDYIAGSINECPETGKAGNILNFCEETVKLNGSIPLRGFPLFKIDDTELTAIAVTTAQNLLHTVAFLGTGNGKLLKVLLKPEISQSRLFEQVIVDTSNEPVLSDLIIDNKQKFIYAATSKKVVKIMIEHCPKQSNCTECLNLGNPFCGWCSLEKKCNSKVECLTRTDFSLLSDTRIAFSTPRWLPVDSAQCINFEKITPNFIPIDKRENIHLTIHQLPLLPYGSSYICVFNDKIITPAFLASNGLKCATPELSDRPIIKDGLDHVTVKLSVKTSNSETPFIQKTFVFYDCNIHKTCRSCVTSEFVCNWCKTSNSCSSDHSECSDRNVIISENGPFSSYTSKGVNYCPSFKIDNEILIPNGVSKEIILKIQNLNVEQDGFKCMMEIENAREIVKATVENGHLVCAKNVYTFLSDVAQYHAQLTVFHNGDTFIDRTNVTLYKCELMGSYNNKADCSLCQSSANRFQCAFCANQCSFKENCGLEEPTICPPPRIDSVHPLSGPIEGGTLLTIEGSNLGSSIDQLRNKISIGSASCEPIQVIASIRLVCKTQPPDQLDQQYHSSKVVVANSAGLTFSKEKFEFKKIELKGVFPKIGPQSGGSLLYLNGENFNVGSSVQIYLDEIKCDVDKQEIASKQLTCRTRQSLKAPRQIQTLSLIIDNANLTLNKPFLYTENPSIISISPDHSYLSGGRIINIFGERFLSIQSPKMGVFFKKQLINETYCNVINDTLMHCPTPSVKEFTRNFRLINGAPIDLVDSDSQINDLANNLNDQKTNEEFNNNKFKKNEAKPSSLKFKISFGSETNLNSLPLISDYSIKSFSFNNKHNYHQDSLSKLSINSNIGSHQENFDQLDQQDEESHQKSFFNFNYVQDPKVYKLDQKTSSFSGNSLVILGENLNNAVSESEINVTIGGAECTIISLAENQLTCSAIIKTNQYKFNKEKLLDKNNNILSSLLSLKPNNFGDMLVDQPPVIVKYSQNLEFHLGFLNSEDTSFFKHINKKSNSKLNNDEIDLNELNSGSEGFFSREEKKITENFFIKGIVISVILLIIFCSILLISFKRKSNEVEKEYKRMQMQMDTLENSVRLECKQAFAELQTDLNEVNNLTYEIKAFFLPGIKYISNIFFPGLGVNPLSSDYQLHNDRLFHFNNGQLVEELILSKSFLLTFIDILEQQPSFTLRDRINVASLLMIILIEKMEYAFCILEELLLKSIENYAKSKHPQLLLRRTEFIVEKMLVNFLAITMEKSLSENTGNKLFFLCNAIKSQTEKGPIDFYTHEARYTLDEERLLKQQTEFNIINLIVYKIHGINEKIEYQVKVLDCDCITQVKNKILDVVYKNIARSERPETNNVILEHNYAASQIYSNQYSLNQNINDCKPQSIYGQNIILEDDDDTTQTINNWRQINTVKHYNLIDNSIITMRVLNESSSYPSDSMSDEPFDYSFYDNYTDSGTGHLYECIKQETNLLLKNRQCYINKYSSQRLPNMLENNSFNEDAYKKDVNLIYGYSTGTLKNNYLLKQNQQQQIPLINKLQYSTKNKKNSTFNVYYTLNSNNSNKKLFSATTLAHDNQFQTNQVKHYHLNKEIDELKPEMSTMKKNSKNRSDSLTQNKIIKEIYLTRLLSTKGTLQKYIDEFFSAVLTCDNKTPIIVKWLFDLLDEAAQKHGINNSDIVYAWKCNSLPLRFWVNLLKNPNFLFDIEKTSVLDYNLNVIAQAFLDSCSFDQQVLNKESHSAKLLFARDIPRYREMVKNYYDDIKKMPKIKSDQMLNELKDYSKKFADQVDKNNAINELFVYLTRYRETLLNTFYNESFVHYKKLQLVFESVYSKS